MDLKKLGKQLPAAAEYLTQIFFIERDRGSATNSLLADRLQVSRPAVSQAAGRLKKLGLVIQDRYGTIGLSEIGREIAVSVVRRHFLLEHLLVRVLGFPWDEADHEAAELQVYLSDKLTDHLDRQFNHPQTCPHGNPMPGAKIEKKYLDMPTLPEAEEGSAVRIMRITEEGEMIPELLTFCQQRGLGPGKKIDVEVQRRSDTLCRDGSVKMEIPQTFAVCLRWEPA